jgi:ClpP class serine protease
VPTYQALVDNLEKGATVLDGAQLGKQRREKIQEIQQLTGRPLIVYFSNFTKTGSAPPNSSIDDSDVTAFSDLVEDVPGRDLDLLLHTPGGIVESAERIVSMLRSRFDSIRVLVPHSAYSAGTLISFATDGILMDERSTLGPVDPQLGFRDPNTGETMNVPAQAILAGFNRAKEAMKDQAPEVMRVYLPLVNKMSLHLLELCRNAEALTRTLAVEFLKKYMFKGEDAADGKADAITSFFSSHEQTMSHRRGVGIIKAQELGLKVVDTRATPKVRAAIWELFCAVEFFTDMSGDTAKFYENAFGVSWRRRFQIIQAQLALGQPGQQPQIPGPGPGGGKKKKHWR